MSFQPTLRACGARAAELYVGHLLATTCACAKHAVLLVEPYVDNYSRPVPFNFFDAIGGSGSINLLAPDYHGPVLVPPMRAEYLPDVPALRRGWLLESAVQEVYARYAPGEIKNVAGRRYGQELPCTCGQEDRDRNCPHCIDTFMMYVTSRLGASATGPLDDFRIEGEGRKKWPALCSVFDGEHQAKEMYFGTPDRLDLGPTGLVGTEFKSGNATLAGTQRLVAECWAESGVPIVVGRISMESDGQLQMNQLVSVPRAGKQTYAPMRSEHPLRAGDVLFGKVSLVDYWRQKGTAIPDDERVYEIEIFPGKPPSLYPESLLKPMAFNLELDEVISALDEPFPWPKFPTITEWVLSQKQAARRRSDERQARIAGRCPYPADIPYMTADEIRSAFHVHRLLDDDAIERLKDKHRRN